MFSARRKPKRIASSEPSEDDIPQNQPPEQDDSGPVVRRPGAPKQKSKLRMTFDPDVEGDDYNSSDAPMRSSRVGASSLAKTAPVRQRDEDEEVRPSYSKSYLDELKGSTPSTPKDLTTVSTPNDEDSDMALIQPQTQALDIASKFGASASMGSGAIPSAAEIAEKKARRERLAKEAQASALTASRKTGGSIRDNDDYVNLDAYDSDGEFKPSRLQVSTYTQKDRQDDAQEYTRLVPEDEDVAEGFEDFTEDHPMVDGGSNRSKNRIMMGMKADPKKERDQMRKMIATAEGGASESDGDEDDSGSERSDASAEHAYVAAQTRHGAGFSHLSKEERRRQEKEATRPRQPEKTTPIPTLTQGLARLKELKESAEMNKQRAERRKTEIERRLKEVDDEKMRIQSALEDLGQQLEEADRKVQEQASANGQLTVVAERGLDNLTGS